MLTASKMGDVLDITKTGKPGAGRVRVLKELVAERLTGLAASHYMTQAMQWGIDHQGDAISHYEIVTGEIVAPEALIFHPTIEYLAATPDGFIGLDGLLEVKCPTTTTHMQWLIDGVVPEQHHPQLAVQLMCTGRSWADFMSFDPRMQRKEFIRRYSPTAEYIEMIEKEAIRFLAEVEALFILVSESS